MGLLMPLVVVVLVAGPATSAPTWGGLEAFWILRVAYVEQFTQEMLQTPPTPSFTKVPSFTKYIYLEFHIYPYFGVLLRGFCVFQILNLILLKKSRQ